jgi:hypothetical protein
MVMGIQEVFHKGEPRSSPGRPFPLCAPRGEAARASGTGNAMQQRGEYNILTRRSPFKPWVRSFALVCMILCAGNAMSGSPPLSDHIASV